ncbi:MAG TPA: hypothetical protein DCY13_14725, partial [Verrucomicrobiales bacterium]|nr:hypothetical protein [Verrucomicrobiales bacterium]
GQLEGTVTARPAVDELVNADFAVQVNGFASELLNVDRLNLDGALHWPQLIVSNASFSFPDAGAFRLGGELQLLDRSLTNVHWSYRGALPTNLVPAGLSLETVTASGTASGRWPDLTHRTELAVMRPDW